MVDSSDQGPVIIDILGVGVTISPGMKGGKVRWKGGMKGDYTDIRVLRHFVPSSDSTSYDKRLVEVYSTTLPSRRLFIIA